MIGRLLIRLKTEEESEKERIADCNRIAREIDDIAANPDGEVKVVVVPVDKRKASLIQSQLTPTFFADYSFKFEDYLGQMDVYQRLVVEINRRSLAA